MLKLSPSTRLFLSRNLILAVAVCVFSGAATTVQADTLLRFKHTPGEKLTYECKGNTSTTMVIDGKTMTSKVKNGMVFSSQVKSVDTDGVATVLTTIERVKMSMTMPQGQNLEYDSAEEKDRSGMEKMIADQFAGMVGKPFETKIDAMGNISDMKMPEGFADKMGMGAMFGGQGMKQMTASIAFPQEAVAVGKTWTATTTMAGLPGLGKMTVQQTYEYMGPDKADANLQKIHLTIKMEMESAEGAPVRMKLKDQQSKGEMLFDNRAGRLQQSNVTSKMDFEMDIMGQSMTNSTTTTMEIKLLPNSGAK